MSVLGSTSHDGRMVKRKGATPGRVLIDEAVVVDGGLVPEESNTRWAYNIGKSQEVVHGEWVVQSSAGSVFLMSRAGPT